MSVEACIDRLDSFMSNSAPYHLPDPLKWEALDTGNYERWDAAEVALRPQINEILENYDIQNIRWWLRA